MKSSTSSHILIVEDDVDIREALHDFLTEEGYSVETAENGALALFHLNATSTLPALILLDMSMPIMDGQAFRSEQLRISSLAHIPTAILSADGNIKEKAQRAGDLEFLKKPIELNDLLELVKKYCTKTS